MDIVAFAGFKIIGFFRQLDDLFDSGLKHLGHFALHQIQFFIDFFEQAAAGPFSEDGYFGFQIDAGFKI